MAKNIAASRQKKPGGLSDKVSDIVLVVICAAVMLIVAYPLYYVLVASFSDPYDVYAGKTFLLPSQFTLKGYQAVFADSALFSGFINSIKYTVIGTIYSVVMIYLVAYPLSVKDLPGRKYISLFFVITMYFGGGLVPTYLIVKQTGLLGSMWALFLPGVVAVGNVIIVRNFFENNIPRELLEAAEIDGASKWTVFVKMVIPLSRSIMAVMVVYSMVAYWNDWFTAEDMAAYVPGFVQDGIIDGKQVVFPVSKSTQLIFLNGSQYARFAADTGAQLSTLATWDGFFEMAGAYRQWSQGKPFCALDYPLRLVELNALEQGSGKLYKGSWYDLTNETFRASWMEFARALVQGDILISDLYSNTQVMTGETLAGLGSSAAILYYNDFVTYPDNTTEPTDLLLAPLPHAAGTATPLMPQAGVGLCAFKTTDQKAEAAAVFLRWLTEQQRNLEFAADTGYMPVSSAAFDAIADYPFEQQSYQRLYDVYNEMRIQNTPLSEPGIVGYHAKAKTLYDSLRQRQKDYPQRLADGETLEALAEETWQLLCDNA